MILHLYLTRQHDGSYMATAFRPIITKVKGTDYEDAYVRDGDPIGMRHMCALGIKTALDGRELGILETVRIKMDIQVD